MEAGIVHGALLVHIPVVFPDGEALEPAGVEDDHGAGGNFSVLLFPGVNVLGRHQVVMVLFDFVLEFDDDGGQDEFVEGELVDVPLARHEVGGRVEVRACVLTHFEAMDARAGVVAYARFGKGYARGPIGHPFDHGVGEIYDGIEGDAVGLAAGKGGGECKDDAERGSI